MLDLRGKTDYSGATSAVARDPEVAQEPTLDFMLLSRVTEAQTTARRIKGLPALKPLQDMCSPMPDYYRLHLCLVVTKAGWGRKLIPDLAKAGCQTSE